MTSILDIFLPYQKRFFQAKQKRKFWISGRQQGKSFTMAGILVYKALSKKNGLSLCISTGSRAASEIIRKCAQFAEAVKQLSHGQIDYTSSYDTIKFSNGSRVMSLPSSTDGANLRGFSASAVVIDEACFVYHLDQIMEAIAPTLTRDPDAELVFASTPSGKNSFAYKLWQQAQADENWYTQTTTIEQAVQDGLKVDIQQLKQLCPDEDSFQREYMCKWADSSEDFIDSSILQFKEPPMSGQYVFGYDVGRRNDNSAIAILKIFKDEIYVEDVVVLKKVQYADQKHRLQQLKQQYQFLGGYIDQGGIGSAFAEDINHTMDPRYKGYSFTGSNKTPMYEALRAKMFDKKIFFAKHLEENIKADFSNISKIVTENGQVKYEAGHNFGHSDITSAIVLAIQATKDFKPTTTLPTSLGNWSSAFGGYRSRL